METIKPHNIVSIEGLTDARQRDLEPIPRRQLSTVQAMTPEQRGAWLDKRRAKRKAAKLARRRNRSKP